MAKKNKVLNKEIKKWLDSKKRDYKEGVKLYYKYAEFGIKVKIFPFHLPKENINRLTNELEHLSYIDPAIKEEAIENDIEEKKKQAAIQEQKPLYDAAMKELQEAIKEEDFDKASDLYDEVCDHNYLGNDNPELAQCFDQIDELHEKIKKDAEEEEQAKKAEEQTHAKEALLEINLDNDPDYNTMLHIAAILEIGLKSKKKVDIIDQLKKYKETLTANPPENE